MQRRWAEKNVDLNQLCAHIEDFFRNKGFATKKIEATEEHTVLWAPQHAKNMDKTMKVHIFGEPNDFVVEFLADKNARRYIWLGMLTKSIGGGYLVRQGSRLQEVLGKIEREFWVYMEDKIAQLTDSAKPS